ncbi:hypothetical protein OU5_4628 [Pseudomonas mandelii JR-1]|uniref:Uncharacterized protein n=1 Tax=Pseudomonas mandelii JR-1 TaxID=1147786 RepID=A0A024EFY7_9PSED|nr:hypothetical protein OU5_4628 [Pseudomonas mandelii JR-1]
MIGVMLEERNRFERVLNRNARIHPKHAPAGGFIEKRRSA